MQMTVGLVVEVLFAGVLSLVWFLLLMIRLINPSPIQITNTLQYISTNSLLILALLSAMSYILGWVISFLTETILDPFFQTRYRDKYFKKFNCTFYEIRSRVFENSPEHVIRDIQYDRQVIRIARTNAFNFIIIAIVVLISLDTIIPKKIGYILSSTNALLGILSFFQWQFRYRSTFAKFMDLYNEINKGMQIRQNIQKGKSIKK